METVVMLTAEQSKELFYNALCDGCHFLSGYGLELSFDDSEYELAKQELTKLGKNFCYEDILMKILELGYQLQLIDHEGEGAYTRSITLNDVLERVKNTPLPHLTDAIMEQGDAITGDCIIQTVFYNEVIFS